MEARQQFFATKADTQAVLKSTSILTIKTEREIFMIKLTFYFRFNLQLFSGHEEVFFKDIFLYFVPIYLHVVFK